MKNREKAVEAAALVLRNSAAADSSLHDSDMRSFAEDLVSVIEAVERGDTIEDAVMAHWGLDEYQQRVEFGTPRSPADST